MVSYLAVLCGAYAGPHHVKVSHDGAFTARHAWLMYSPDVVKVMQQGNLLKLVAPIKCHRSQVVVNDVEESRQTAPSLSLQTRQQVSSMLKVA